MTARELARLRRTAYHEAGHAVVAWRVHARFRRATIEPDDTSLGSVWHYPFNRRFNPDLDEYTARRRLEPHMLTAYAGVLAEKHHTGRRHNWQGAGHDLDSVSRMADWCTGEGMERLHYYRWIQARAQRWVDFLWPQIAAVAEALLERRTLTEAEVKRVILVSYDIPELSIE